MDGSRLSRDGWNPGRSGRGSALIAVAAIACVALGGCGHPQPYVSPARLDRGLVVVLPGIEGRSPFNEGICEGLDDGGVDWAIELYDWTSPWVGPLVNLRTEERNREQARKLADRIARYHMSYPGRPVVLVGQSGGGAIAIWTAEALPPGQSIKGAVLLAAAISPGYMLDAALNNTREGIASFYSERDWLMLGFGTVTNGTMDREFVSSAGRVGFERPATPLRSQHYLKLYEIPWNPSMTFAGHGGGHVTSGARQFVATYVTPLVLAQTWDDQLIRGLKAPLPVSPPAPQE